MESVECAHRFADDDDATSAPHIYAGLGVIDYVVIPHAGHHKYGPLMKEIAEKYVSDGVESVLLNDDQALIVNGSEKRAIGRP